MLLCGSISNFDQNMHMLSLFKEYRSIRISVDQYGNKWNDKVWHLSLIKAKRLTQSWQSKWTETHDIIKESDLSIRGLKHSSSMGVMIESQMPHLVGMDDDILSTGVTIYHLKVKACFPLIRSIDAGIVKSFSSACK